MTFDGAAIVVAATLVIVVSWWGRSRMLRRLMLSSGMREDGTWEDGRSPDDMTRAGKAALWAGVLAFGAMVVLSFVDDVPAAVFGLIGLVLAGTFATVVVSERRRIRRDGVDVGHGPGRLRADDGPAPDDRPD